MAERGKSCGKGNNIKTKRTFSRPRLSRFLAVKLSSEFL